MTSLATVCVDIGNSGMRCVLVPATPGADASTTPWHGELLRFDWPADLAADAIHSAMQQAIRSWLSPLAVETRWRVSSVQRTMESHLRSVTEAFPPARLSAGHL